MWNDSVFAHYSWAHVAILITAAWQFFMLRRAGAGRSCPSICSFWPWALPSNISPDFLFHHNNKQFCLGSKKTKQQSNFVHREICYLLAKKGWPILVWQDTNPMNTNCLLHVCPPFICTQRGTTHWFCLPLMALLRDKKTLFCNQVSLHSSAHAIQPSVKTHNNILFMQQVMYFHL